MRVVVEGVVVVAVARVFLVVVDDVLETGTVVVVVAALARVVVEVERGTVVEVVECLVWVGTPGRMLGTVVVVVVSVVPLGWTRRLSGSRCDR
jgi:hypothetical protein